MSFELRAWLEKAALPELYDILSANEVDLDVLSDISDEELREIGVSLGQRKRLRRALAATAAPEAAVAAFSPGPERRRLTVMFIDLVGFTQLSSSVDVEDTRTVIAGFQRCVNEAVTRHGGTVAKYMGDAVLAYFGYPRAEEHAAESAARAGLEALAAIEALDLGPSIALRARAGAATGMVVVGDLVGEGDSLERQVVGDTPNLAARLQALAEPGTLVIAASTHALIGTLFDCRPLGPTPVKGFARPVEVFAVISEREIDDRFRAARNGAALAPLEGRTAELTTLRAVWDKGCRGTLGTAVLVGEAGMGKSRLLAAFADHIAGEAHCLMRLACQPQFANTALQPVTALLGRHAGIGRDDDTVTRWHKLEAMLSAVDMACSAPLFAAILGLPAEGLYDPPNETAQRQRAAFLTASAEWMRRTAGAVPLVVLVEDVHWADATTHEFLAALPDALAGGAAVIVATTRPGGAEALTGRADVTTIALERLSAEATDALVRHVGGGRTLPPEIVARIRSLAEGNPLFVEELTKTLLETGAMRADGDRLVLDGALPDSAIPATLHDSLMARLDKVGPAKEVAQIGAAIGREFSFDLLSAICPVAPDALHDRLARLEDAGIIFQASSTEGVPGWIFKHVLIQEAAYESMLRSRRRDLHAAIARTIETERPNEASRHPEVMAHHLSRAGEVVRAVDFGCAASMSALTRSANAEAVAHARACLSWVRDIPDARTRDEAELRVLALLTPALMQHQGYSSADVSESAGRALALLDALGDQPEVFPALWCLKMFHHVRSERARARELAERFVKLAERVDDDGQRVAGLPMLGQCRWIEGRHAEAEADLRRGVAMYDRESHGLHGAIYGFDSLSYCRMTLSQVLWITGRGDEAMAEAQAALDHARSVNHANSMALSYLYLVMIHQQQRDRDAAARLAAEALAHCERTGASTPTSYIAMIANWAQGDVDASEAIHAVHEQVGAQLGMTYYRSLAVENAIEAGDPDRAAAILAPAMEQARTTGERYWIGQLLRLAARIAAMQGDAPRPLLEEALAVATAQGAITLEAAVLDDLATIGASDAERARLRALLASVTLPAEPIPGLTPYAGRGPVVRTG